MSNLPESDAYPEGIYQLEKRDRVRGGPGGPANVQPQQLADRTHWLKVRMDAAMPNTVVTGVDQADHLISPDSHTLEVTAGALDRTLTLPNPTTVPAMRGFRILKADAGAGKVRVPGVLGGDVVLTHRGDAAMVQSDGTAWVRVADSLVPAAPRWTTVWFTVPGDFTWEVPAGVAQLRVSLQGGGGSGSTGAGASPAGFGGGSGARLEAVVLDVVPGTILAGHVGAGAAAPPAYLTDGTAGADGADSVFGALVAGGGQGAGLTRSGAGGTAAESGRVFRGTPGGAPQVLQRLTDAAYVGTQAGAGGGGGGGRGGSSEAAGALPHGGAYAEAEPGVMGGGGGGGLGQTFSGDGHWVSGLAGAGGDGWIRIEFLLPG